MIENEVEVRRRILLGLQVALLGEVSPALRGVTVGWDEGEGEVLIRCYFDGPIAEEDSEGMLCVETEMMADFLGEKDVRLESLRLDAPGRMEMLRYWVFRRREPVRAQERELRAAAYGRGATGPGAAQDGQD